jgi:hypothetical protein
MIGTLVFFCPYKKKNDDEYVVIHRLLLGALDQGRLLLLLAHNTSSSSCRACDPCRPSLLLAAVFYHSLMLFDLLFKSC